MKLDKEDTSRYTVSMTTTCPECERVFDLANEIDHAEWLYGHDCEE
jgi:hypothetical protein